MVKPSVRHEHTCVLSRIQTWDLGHSPSLIWEINAVDRSATSASTKWPLTLFLLNADNFLVERIETKYLAWQSMLVVVSIELLFSRFVQFRTM